MVNKNKQNMENRFDKSLDRADKAAINKVVGWFKGIYISVILKY